MITVNGWCAVGEEGVGKWGGVRVQSMGEMGKDFCPNVLNLFLKTWTEGAVTTEAGSLLQYFTTLYSLSSEQYQVEFGNMDSSTSRVLMMAGVR